MNAIKSLFLLKSQKGYLFKTGQNFAVGKTRVWSAHVWPTAAATF